MPVLIQQQQLGRRLFDALHQNRLALDSLKALRTRVHNAAFERSLAGLGDSLTRLNGDLATLYSTVQDVDAAPTTQTVATITAKSSELDKALASWKALRGRTPSP
jgi:hypothetical protein